VTSEKDVQHTKRLFISVSTR